MSTSASSKTIRSVNRRNCIKESAELEEKTAVHRDDPERSGFFHLAYWI
jgi:hypothetical protein